jgi:hypothetical protein
MWNSDFELAAARLCFLQAYLKWLKDEVNMKAKNEREHAKEVPNRRRFWHRRPAPAAPPAPAKPASGQKSHPLHELTAAES